MKKVVITSIALLGGCTNIQSTPTALCNSSGPVSIIAAQPTTDYITCGNIQVEGSVINNAAEVNQILIAEGGKLKADAVITLQKIDSFNWSEARVRRLNAVAIQFK